MEPIAFDPSAGVMIDGNPLCGEAVLARDPTSGAYFLALDLDDSSEIEITLRHDFLDAFIAGRAAAAA